MNEFFKQVLLFSTKSFMLMVLVTIFSLIGIFLIVEPAVSRITRNRELSVDGVVKKYIEPDIAYINISAIISGVNAAEVKQQADTALTKTNEELLALNIEPGKIQTSYSVSPKYDKDYQNIIGYTADPSLIVKAKDFSLVDKVITIAEKNKLSMVNSVYFTIEDPIKAKEELRNEAIEAAKTKATELTKETGIRLGNIINISENSYQPYYGIAKDMALPNSISSSDRTTSVPEAESAFDPGETEISFTVYLTYEVY